MMNMATPPTGYKNETLWFLLALGCYFALHVALRVVLSDTLEYDEAEQALLSQWLLPGYTEQPPLYTWLQRFFFALFGKNVFAVSLLKNILLFCTYVCVFFSANEILKDRRAAILATASLLFIPQIGWESQRDITHTILVVLAAAATLWQAMRLIHRQSVTNYCILGLLLGMGFLAKANFALFVSILTLTLCSFAEGRKIIFSKKILISLLITTAVTLSYFLWMFGNQDIVFSATHKFKSGIEKYWQKGTISLVTKSFLFLTPLWFICLLIFPKGFAPNRNPVGGFHYQFIRRYLVFLFIFLILLILFLKVAYVKDRWLQPLLFVVPIFFFARLDPATISPKRFKLFLGTVVATALVIYLALTLRVVGASYTHSFCRLNYPFTAIEGDLRRMGFVSGLIISDNRFVAGNMHLKFPGSTALIPQYRFEKQGDGARYSTAAIVWIVDKSSGIPAEIQSFLETAYNVSTDKYPVSSFEHTYLYARTETIKVAMMLIPLPPPTP